MTENDIPNQGPPLFKTDVKERFERVGFQFVKVFDVTYTPTGEFEKTEGFRP